MKTLKSLKYRALFDPIPDGVCLYWQDMNLLQRSNGRRTILVVVFDGFRVLDMPQTATEFRRWRPSFNQGQSQAACQQDQRFDALLANHIFAAQVPVITLERRRKSEKASEHTLSEILRTSIQPSRRWGICSPFGLT